MPISSIGDRNFGTETDRPCFSLTVNGEKSRICIITGEDDILKCCVDDNPPTVRHEYAETDLISDIGNYVDIRKLNKSLRDCEIRNHILYYWHHGIIQAGCVYWMVNDDDKYYLHDLTASFEMTPFKTSLGDPFCEVELGELWNAIALLYYHAGKQRWQSKYEVQVTAKILELFARVDKFINKDQYPVIWCLSRIMFSDVLLPLETDVDDPTIAFRIRRQPNSADDYRIRKVAGNADAYNQIKEDIIKALSHLRKCISFLKEKHTDNGYLPLPHKGMPPNTKAIDFDLKRFVTDLLNKGCKRGKLVRNLDDAYEKFMTDTDELELRILAHAIRQSYFCSLVQAGVFYRFDKWASGFMFCESALAAWIALTSFMGNEEMPLPLRPLFMMANMFFRFSHNLSALSNAFQVYLPPDKQFLVNMVSNITTINDNRCYITCPKDGDLQTYMKSSFECFARCMLYTDEEPDETLLYRICIAANELVFYYLDSCSASSESYAGQTLSKENYDMAKLLLDVASHLGGNFTEEKKILLATSVLKAIYFKMGSDVLYHELKLYDDSTCSQFTKAFKEFDKALKLTDELNTEITVCKDLVIFEYLIAILEYVWKLRQREDQDKISYHKKILSLYRTYVKLSNDRFHSEGDHRYFRYRRAIGYALIGEYLYGLFREKRNSKIKDEAEKWFEAADKGFKSLNGFYAMEIFKTTTDRMAFYDDVISTIDEPGKVIVEDKKIMDLLIGVLPILQSLSLAYSQEGGSATRRIILMKGVLRALDRRLVSALFRRMLLSRQFNIRIDIPIIQIRGLYFTSLNRQEVPVLLNLLSVLEQIQALLNR